MLLQIKNLQFSYEPERPLFEDFNLNIDHRKVVALAGESGCGKSSLLSLIYGLMDWKKGHIYFDDREVFGPKRNLVPGEEDMKFVTQNYDLMLYATVAENIGKFLSNIDLKAKKAKIQELLEVVEMENYADVKPINLSGGQQQRVAISRALSVTSKLLLLDEPFGNLDYSRKLKIRENLFNYVKKEGITLIISTHEIMEIIPWLDELIVLKNGKIVQYDVPQNVYNNPKNEYVASLFGEVNVFSQDEIESLSLSKGIYFPTEIKIQESGFEAQVLESRFSGNFYWNKIQLKNKSLIVYTSHFIQGTVALRF